MNNEVIVSEMGIREKLPVNEYYSSIPSIKSLENNSIKFDKNVTFFVGENGAGKSTLIESLAIALGFNPEGGTKNYNFSAKESHSNLYKHLFVAKKRNPRFGYFLRAESFYNVATMEEEYAKRSPFPEKGKKYHEKSHGEAFLALAKDFSPSGIYILDEPEAALSPTRLMQLMCIINDLEKEGAQFIISTHSTILMSYPDADIYQLSERGIERVDYKDTDHYKVTKQFIDNPEMMFQILFEDN